MDINNGPRIIERTFEAWDECGNSTSCIQLITIIDNTPPSFVEALPSDEVASCDNIPPAVILTATDNCSNSIPVIFTESSTEGVTCDNYIITRTWSASDGCSGKITIACNGKWSVAHCPLWLQAAMTAGRLAGNLQVMIGLATSMK